MLDLDGQMSCWSVLRSLGRCSLGKVNLLMAGGAAEVLPVSLVALCHSKEPTPSIISSFLVFATSTVSGLLEVYLF